MTKEDEIQKLHARIKDCKNKQCWPDRHKGRALIFQGVKYGFSQVGYGPDADRAWIMVLGQNPGWRNDQGKANTNADPFEFDRYYTQVFKHNLQLSKKQRDGTFRFKSGLLKHRCGKFLMAALFENRDFKLVPTEVYISNVVQCTTKKNEAPSNAQLQQCRTWLEEGLSIIQPKIVVCLGIPACQRIGVFPGEKINTKLGVVEFAAVGSTHPSYLTLTYEKFLKELVPMKKLIQENRLSSPG